MILAFSGPVYVLTRLYIWRFVAESELRRDGI